MQDMIIYLFDDRPVRTVAVDGDVWWLARDVASILGYERPEKAVIDHCRRPTTWQALAERLGVRVGEVSSEGGPETGTPLRGKGNDTLPPSFDTKNMQPHTKFIGIGDLARLIAKCRLPIGERFESWIFDEVIPQIFKTGSYAVPADDWDWDAIREKTNLVKQTRLAFGRKAAQELWRRLGLPDVGGGVQKPSEVSGMAEHVMDFLDEVTTADPNAEVTSHELHTLYQRWAGRNRAPLVTGQAFGKYMVQTGRALRRKTNGRSVYRGLRIVAEAARGYR